MSTPIIQPGAIQPEIGRSASASIGAPTASSVEEVEVLSQTRWYAAYTCANHEKRVAAEIDADGIEHFLPLYSSVRRWKDRKVRLDLPLFPGYVFLRLALREKLRVLQIPGVVRLVGFCGHPTPLSDNEVEALRRGLALRLNAQPHPYLTVGRKVRVTNGPLAGLEGVIQRKKNQFRFIISLHLIMRSICVEMDEADLKALS